MSRSRGQRRGYRDAKHGDDYWISYADLLASLLLCFILLLLVSNLSNQEANEDLAKKDKQISQQIGVKQQIIEQLLKEFQNSKIMTVDPQTGIVTFKGGVFFDRDSTVISEAGRKNLEFFIPKYVGILLSDNFRNEVDQIVIEGHTDTTGGYLYNLKLSQNRAISVVETIYDGKFPAFSHNAELQKVITANGRSFSKPILGENGQIDAVKSRRVEFKFRLKDEETLSKIQQLVKNK